MERRHITYFLAVVEAGSITEAARRLHLSQPSVSEAIKDLERELRTPLFERGRTLTLTAAGQAMVGPARRALRSLESVKESVRQVTGLSRGVLDIAVAPQLAVDPVVPLIKAFRRRFPGVMVRMHEAEADVRGFEILRRGEAELLFHEHAGDYPKHVAVALPEALLSVAFPPGTEDLPEGPVGLEDLIRYRFILGLSKVSTVRAAFLAELAARDLPQLHFAVETAQLESVIPLVLAGVGATVLSETEAQLAEQLGCPIRPLNFHANRASSLFHRSGQLSPAASAFVELTRRLVASGTATRLGEDQPPRPPQDPDPTD